MLKLVDVMAKCDTGEKQLRRMVLNAADRNQLIETIFGEVVSGWCIDAILCTLKHTVFVERFLQLHFKKIFSL